MQCHSMSRLCPTIYLDIYFPNLKLAIEVDGTQHSEPKKRQHDAIRDQHLRDRGIEVWRYTAGEILRDCRQVACLILFRLKSRSAQRLAGSGHPTVGVT